MDNSYEHYEPQPGSQPVQAVHFATPPPVRPNPAQSYHSARTQPHPGQPPRTVPAQDASFASSGQQEMEDSGDGQEGEESDRGEDEDGMSNTSSAMYDPAADPAEFAKRLDELAGILEMSEEESRALRQGPVVGKRKKGVSILSDAQADISFHTPTLRVQELHQSLSLVNGVDVLPSAAC
jgi:hypothetical protein